MHKGLIKTAAEPINPLRILLVFGILSFFVLVFHIPERITAFLFLSFFFVISALNPINGAAFILLSIPFFLGAPHKPYFYLFEILVYGYLIIGFIHLWKRKTAIEIPFKPLIILLTLSCLFSLPINAKEYYYQFWATPLKDIGFQYLTGHEKFPFCSPQISFQCPERDSAFCCDIQLVFENRDYRFGKVFKGVDMDGCLHLPDRFPLPLQRNSLPTQNVFIALTGRYP